MAVEAYLPSLVTVLVTAAVDSINPCAIGVLILMISVLLSTHNKLRRLLLFGGLYIASIYVVYFLAGLGLMYGLASVPLAVAEYISIAVGLIVVIAGMFEIKDYFWYGRWFSLGIPEVFARKMRGFATRTSVPGIILLGAFVSAVELPCTGAPYLAIITVLSQYFDFKALILLAIYNVVFVLPLLVILLLVALGVKLQTIKRWKQLNRPYMRLATGILLVGMGWLLMLIANGTVNLG